MATTRLPIYQVDAFADKTFEGNPAAVVPLVEWLPDETMQAIAAENNLAETAFFVPVGEHFHIRWFTPTREVKLCGHATLASAFVLFESLAHQQASITFDSLSGPLSVTRTEDLFTLDFPSRKPETCTVPDELIRGLGKTPSVLYKHDDYLAVYDDESDVSLINPDFSYLEKLDMRGVIVTAPSREYDFVARFFAPKYGIPEDPVTGSAYTQLAPYWSERMNKTRLSARQLSGRGGTVICESSGDRVLISGRAIQYMEGTIAVSAKT